LFRSAGYLFGGPDVTSHPMVRRGRRYAYATATNTWTAIAYDQGTQLAGTCATGMIFFKTDATAGQNLYYCTATNTWTQQGRTKSIGVTFDAETAARSRELPPAARLWTMQPRSSR